MSFDSTGYKLFLGGLTASVNEAILENYFSKYGETQEVAIITDKAGITRGFGFVTFKDEASMSAALAEGDEHAINGLSVEVKRSTHGESASSTSKKVFVGGVGPSVTKDTLRDYFSSFGTVSDAQVMYDYGSGRSRGFGFVTFENEDAAKLCLETKVHVMAGQIVDVKPAMPRPGEQNGAGGIVPGYQSHNSHNSHGSHGSYGSHASLRSQGSQGSQGGRDGRMGGIPGMRGYAQSYGVYGPGNSGNGMAGGYFPYPYMTDFSQYQLMSQYHPNLGYAPHVVGNPAPYGGQMTYDQIYASPHFMMTPTDQSERSSRSSLRSSGTPPTRESNSQAENVQ